MSEAASRQGVRTGDETKDYIFSRTYIYIYIYLCPLIALQLKGSSKRHKHYTSYPVHLIHIYIYIYTKDIESYISQIKIKLLTYKKILVSPLIMLNFYVETVSIPYEFTASLIWY